MEFIKSPHFWKGRKGQKPGAIVIHRGEGSFGAILNWFLNPTSFVSSHYIVAKNGYIVQMVKDENTAWHCGIIKKPKWQLLKKRVNPNRYTIGIETEGYAGKPAPFVQHLAVARLVKEIAKKWKIKIDQDHIIPHNWIRSDKTCPGRGIDINWIIEQAKKYG